MNLSPLSRDILRIAVPSVISNVTIPLLALADAAIAGHLGAAAYIGAIAVGGLVFNVAYWLFGFLRMSTGAFAAQACGAGRHDEALHTLLRSLAVALGVSLALILLQRPVEALAFRLVEAPPDVTRLAAVYFRILIWGAPAVLSLYSLAGWFLGMQDARTPMTVAIVQNVVNIAASLTLTAGLGLKVEGVATGTLVAQYAGLALALLALRRRLQADLRLSLAACRPATVFRRAALARFFHVNRDIFLRTLCLVAVTTAFTSAGAAQGDLVLAANALLMQFFMLFSYLMDGLAYAGEALGGRLYGAADRTGLHRLTRRLFAWGAVAAAVFTAAYAGGGHWLLGLLTDQADVARTAARYLPYAAAVPAVSFAAFLLDGIFIGTTSTRAMLLSMSLASAAFFALWLTLRATAANDALWLAFLLYLLLRGVIQGALYGRMLRK